MNALNLRINDIDLVAWIGQQNGQQYVAVKPLCEVLGLAANKQQMKLLADPKFSCNHMVSTGSDGKQYKMLCIPVDEIGLWLCGINSLKVKPEVQGPLLQFQKKLQVVIHEAISGRLSVEQMNALTQQVGLMAGQIQWLYNRVAELEEAQGISVSNAARTLRQGHLTLVH